MLINYEYDKETARMYIMQTFDEQTANEVLTICKANAKNLNRRDYNEFKVDIRDMQRCPLLNTLKIYYKPVYDIYVKLWNEFKEVNGFDLLTALNILVGDNGWSFYTVMEKKIRGIN